MSTLTSPTRPSPIRPAPDCRTPPLQTGDRMTRVQYMQKYGPMPEYIKAERIEGIVYMAAAVSAGFHGKPHARMLWWLVSYQAMTPGTEVANDSTIHLDVDNDPQPDACLYVLPTHGGRVKMDADGYIVGSPEFIAEIAASSMSYDLGSKQNVYRRNGVKEYVVHRTYDGEIDWFVLRDGQYEKVAPDAEGIYRSEAFPGLWLAATAMVIGDLATMSSVLQRGLAGSDHAAFAGGLEAAATPEAD